MSKIWQILNKEVSIQSIASVILAIIVLYWMFNRYALEFYTALFAILLASAGSLIYLLIGWRRINHNDKLKIGLSIVAWLFIFYGVVHANGLTIKSLMWWQG